MSSGRPDNNPSSSHQGASVGHTHHQQGSSGQQSNQSAATRLAYYRSNTSRLLEFIKQCDRDSLDQFISIVRAGASHDDIFAIIDQLSPVTDEQSRKRTGVSN
ncbi:hypothetical protein PENSUB_1637 [Penicillium subrubescens]|uniref:Uncharacterized protein n=1 Tax=Penicillium subrubescens TaxID=1316194 RepID=A0A1Q5UJP3_9EURO|nr:hypothetical protein PENSUB_1637 [Penicillium subrubescens]